MPHQCVRCDTLYEDGAKEILKGCSCGGKLFLFIKKSRIEELKKELPKLDPKQKEEIEEDVRELVGYQGSDSPIVLDFESIRIAKPGSYEIDLVHLFKNEPLVFKLEEGKYMIDLPETFKESMSKDKEKS